MSYGSIIISFISSGVVKYSRATTITVFFDIWRSMINPKNFLLASPVDFCQNQNRFWPFTGKLGDRITHPNACSAQLNLKLGKRTS